MQTIIVTPKDEEELKFVSELLNKLGVNSLSQEEYEFQKRLEARKKFAELVASSPKIDISDEEIDEIVEEVRAKRYAGENKNNH